MRINPASALTFILLLLLTGCATKIAYAPTDKMGNKDASITVEQLTMMQTSKWKPDNIQINENYILWSYGSVSELDPLGNYSNHDLSERIYFNSILEVQLMSEKRLTGQWYVVSIIKRENNNLDVYHTQSVNEAKRYIDALESLMTAYKK